jgi:hypothetical protein
LQGSALTLPIFTKALRCSVLGSHGLLAELDGAGDGTAITYVSRFSLLHLHLRVELLRRQLGPRLIAEDV